MNTDSPSVEPAEIALLKQARLRLTPQRLAILRELMQHDHPTVAQVYDAVRQQFPTLGLATVYATINTLAERGLLRALPFTDAVRYDVNVNPHANLVCTRCHRIRDFAGGDDVLAVLRERASAESGFQLQAERIDLLGLCLDCQEASVGQGRA